MRRKVAGYGWPGPGANGCARKGVRVRLPCLPLRVKSYAVPMVKRRSRLGPNEEVPGSSPGRDMPLRDAPVVKRRSSLASNEVFRVRILAGVMQWVHNHGRLAQKGEAGMT